METVSSDKVIEVRRAYQKEWRAKNKDRVREYNRRFWEKRAAKQDAIAVEQRAETSAN